MSLNRAIAGYIATSVPSHLRGPVLEIIEAYCADKTQPVTFTGTQELARHMDAIACIIDNQGVRDDRIAQGGC